jgi:hypothetical protein
VKYSRHHFRPDWLPNNLELDRYWRTNTKEHGWYVLVLPTTGSLDKFCVGQADPERKRISVIGPFRRKIEAENYARPTVGLEPKKYTQTPAEQRKQNEHFQQFFKP